MGIEQTNLIKLIATFFVVVIHTTAFEENKFIQTQQLLSFEFLGSLFNQLARFSVPLFIFLSGYGLAKSVGRKRYSLKEFYLKRSIKIILPYAFVTVLFSIFVSHKIKIPLLFSIDTFYSEIKKMGFIFVTGRADYHTYFLSIILQLYIIFPLLYKFRNISLLILFLVINLFFTYPIYDIVKNNIFYYPYFPAFVFIPWLIYFYAGIIWVKYETVIITKMASLKKQHLMIFLGGFTSLAFLYVVIEFISRSKINAYVGNFDHFHRLSVLLFSTSIWIIVFHILSQKKILTANTFLNNMAAVTFATYLYHPTTIRLSQQLNFPLSNVPLSIVVFSITIITVYLIHKFSYIPLWIKKITGVGV